MSKDTDLIWHVADGHPSRLTVLEEAASIIKGSRQGDYGDPERNHQRIAKAWSAYLDIEVTPRDVCNLMILLKVCRDRNNPKRDNHVDAAGYSQLAEEV